MMMMKFWPWTRQEENDKSAPTFADNIDMAARLNYGSLDEPRQAEADEDVKHV